MLPVSKEFHAAMVADNRRTFGRVVVDYTDPLFDQSITVTANQQANAAVLLPQVADNLATVPRRWASADGTTLADGNSSPAPDTPADGQMGWWGTQMAETGGAFSAPFPTVTVNFASRPVHSLRVVGDSARGEFPVDFEIRLLGLGGAVRHTHTVTGNALMVWQETITPVTEVLQYVLEVRRWSHAGRQAKVTEVFTSIQETYEGDNLISISLLEERELAQRGLPVGVISANEITVKLDNSTRRFDAGNRESPLYQLLVQNRRIRAWLGLKGDGSGINMRQAVDFNTGTRRNLVVNAGRLELPPAGDPTFARASIAFRQDGTLVNTNLPRFEAGRFGQAVMIEEGTTNLVAEMMSQARSGLASNNAAFTTLTLVSDFGRSSNFSALSEQVAAGSSAGFFASGEANWQSVTAGLIYTASCWVFTNAVGRSATLFITYRDAVNANLGSFSGATTPLVAGTWTRITTTGAAPANAVRAQLGATASISQIGERFWYTDLQLEQKPYATSWQLGGTSRSGEVLTIPTAGIFTRGNWTIEGIYTPQIPLNVGNVEKTLFAYEIDGSNWLRMRVGWGGEWNFAVMSGGVQRTISSANNAVIQGVPYQWMIAGDGANMRLCVNGLQIGTDTAYTEPVGTMPANLFVGSRPNGTLQANGLIDDLRISNRARTDAEIAAAFASGQPLPVDANTTYLLRMDGNLNHGQGGDYTSPEYDLSTVGTAITSGITWQAPADGVTRDVSARLDGQAWTPVTNGGALPFSPGQLLTGRRLQLHALLRRE